jgi:phenylpropionate dioxygenase-like ring-hydroxylating dioxygenase large terminal subunit
MLPHFWYAILESSEVKKNKPIGVLRLGLRLVLWRDTTGKVACISDQCIHRGASLCIGKIISGKIQCPFHGLEYDHTGRVTLIPANGKVSPVPSQFKVKGFPIQEAHGFIWLWNGEFQDQFPPLPWIEDLTEKWAYHTYRQPIPVHYTRAIENQLDLPHLPFVHYNTIGSAKETIIDGPKTKIEKNILYIWSSSRKEDGTPAKHAEDMPEPTEPPIVEFHFPNLWQLNIGPIIRIFLAFIPVDEENTIYYLRFYQRIIRIPLLKQIIAAIGTWSSRIILNQDQHVVETQIPKKTSLIMGEKLIEADLPIILFRKYREAILDQLTAEKTNQ